MLGGGSRRHRRPGILRSLFILFLLASLLVNRSPPTTPTFKSGSPVDSAWIHHHASINDPTILPCQTLGRSQATTTGRNLSRCLFPICTILETTSPTQFSPGLTSILLWVKRLRLTPVKVRVIPSQRKARSLSGLCKSGLYTPLDPCLSPSWLFCSVRYHSSSTLLFQMEKILMTVLCSGPPEMLAFILDKHLMNSSLLLDTTSVQTTQTLSMSLNETLSTSGYIPVLTPIVGRSKGSNPPNPTGDCNLSHCSSRQDRYYLPTPIVLNLYSKFIVDIGVLHGSNSVMVEVYLSSDVCTWRVKLVCVCNNHHCPSNRDRYDFHRSIVLNLLIKLFLVNFGLLHGFDDVLNSIGTIMLSPILNAWRLSLIFDQVFHRICAACLTGCNISVTLLISILEVSFDGLQRYTKLTVATFGFGDKLERKSHMKWELGLSLIRSVSLIYLLDQKATHRSAQCKWFQLELKHYIYNWISVFRNLCLLCKWKVEPLGLHYPRM